MAAGAFAVLAIGYWILLAEGMINGSFAMSGTEWHAHEMIFGYATAAIGGFFLTAVPNWTGARAAPERFIAAAAGLWLAGRVAMWFSGYLPGALVMVLDLAFVPVLAAKILTQLLHRPKPQNMVFFVLLTLIWAGNLLVHLQWLGVADTLEQGMRGGLLTICAMIAVLGGRVTPAFTRNAMVRAGREEGLPRNRAWADRAGSALPVLLAALVLAGVDLRLWGAVAVAAGVLCLIRLSGWRFGWTRHQPIIWALHLGYAMLGLGLICLGLSGFGIGSLIGALHILGIGAVGGMTLAVMSRATLGHSGRALIAPAPVALAYALIPLSLLARLAALHLPGQAMLLWAVSGSLWCLAFALYLGALWPAFTGPRLRA